MMKNLTDTECNMMQSALAYLKRLTSNNAEQAALLCVALVNHFEDQGIKVTTSQEQCTNA